MRRFRNRAARRQQPSSPAPGELQARVLARIGWSRQQPVRSPEEGAMPAHQLLDAAGRPRSPATMPGHHAGRIPPNKGRRYPADPPTVDEIVAVMRQAGDTPHGRRMRGLIVVLWRAGARIHEALTLAETDLNERRGSLLIRHGLCRIRHNTCYAESRLMPSTRRGRPVWAAKRNAGCRATRH